MFSDVQFLCHSSLLSLLFIIAGCPTVCVSGLWAGWDNAWEQEKPEARKMLVNRAESHKSTARFVGQPLC
jgi:hypothetical protein